MPKLSSVLLVDDDSTTNFLNQLLLSRLGIAEHLLVAENGAEALHLLNQSPAAPAPEFPALILLDVNMPVMNGIEFLQAYQQLPPARQQHTVVVVLTTSLHTRDMQQVQQLPVAGVVDKPLTEEKIDAILRQYFRAN